MLSFLGNIAKSILPGIVGTSTIGDMAKNLITPLFDKGVQFISEGAKNLLGLGKKEETKMEDENEVRKVIKSQIEKGVYRPKRPRPRQEYIEEEPIPSKRSKIIPKIIEETKIQPEYQGSEKRIYEV